jgi:hypothetical protein
MDTNKTAAANPIATTPSEPCDSPAQPSLTMGDLIGDLPKTSNGAAAWVKQYNAAEEAVGRADADELFRLYESVCRDRAEVMSQMLGVMRLYSGSKDEPVLHKLTQGADSIAAMERVALAAIDLAKQIVAPPRKDADSNPPQEGKEVQV